MADIEKKEKENFLRHAILVVDHCKDALRSLIERDITLKGVTFEQFLNNNQHDIFHMCKEKICHCGLSPNVPRVFFKSQVELLFDIGIGAAKPGITSEVIDMTLARCLLVNFCFDVFWNYNLQYHRKALEDFLHSEKHTIYHLWQYNSRCCHCPTVFNSTLKFPKVNQYEWQSMFHKPLPQPPCRMKTRANAFPCNSLCDYEAQRSVTVPSLSPRLQKVILDNCCTLRKLIEKLIDIRNFNYGHAEKARMTDSDFEAKMNEITGIIYHIGKLCGKEQEVRTAVNVTLRESLDHKLVEKYKEVMSEIYKNLQQQNKKIQEMESNIVQTNTRIDVVSSSVDIIYNRADDTNAELERTNTRVDVISNRVDDTKTELGRANRKVDVISNIVDDTKTELGRTNTRVDVISNIVDDIKTELGRTNTKVDVISNRVDNTDAGLETLQTKINDTDQRLGIVSKQVDDPLPPNIREQNTNDLKKWKKENEDFVPTRASKHIYDCVASNSCVTITGPAGCGKTFLARHTALVLEKDGYDIIIIKSPKDIRNFYKRGRKTVFIVDDICGNFTASQEKIDNWLQFKDDIDEIVKDQNCKIIVSCRLQVYRDDNFKSLSHFLSCECNLISESFRLSLAEKAAMVKQYTGEEIDTCVIREKIGTTGAFLPLLCSLYRNKSGTSALNFLQNPFGEITEELDNLWTRKEDSSKYKICSLALCVLFNNNLDADWFKGEITQEQRSCLDDLSDACKLNRRLSKQSLEDELNTLVDTFIIKVTEVKWRLSKTKYKAIHDKVFDYFAWYFGKKIISCIIKHGDSRLIHERFRWNLEEIDRSGDMEYIIIIPDEHRDQYIGKMVTDWSNGKVSQVLNNINMRQQDFLCALLRKNPDVNLCDEYGRSPLWIACYIGNVEIVSKLLEKDPDVNLCDDKESKSPLWIACENGNVEIVSKLLEKDPDVNLCDEYGRSPLWIACYAGNVEIVSKLLEKDPDVNLCDEYGRSPLWIACYIGNVEIVSKLLEKDPDVNLCDNQESKSPLWIACANGNVEIVSKLLEKDLYVNLCDKYGQSPLWIACLKGNVEIVSKLLEKNPDINLCNRLRESPLWIACRDCYVEIVSKLLEKDPDVNLCDKYGRSPLWIACLKGNVEIVSMLLEKDLYVNLCDKYGQSPLWIACLKGNVEIVSKLLEKDPDVNLCDEYGRSPLVVACYDGNVEIVSKLLEKDPYVDLCNADGRSPLWVACSIGNVEIVSKLLEKDPDVNLCDEYGRSPLWIACDRDDVEIVSKLLEKNPDINLCNRLRESPLWIACRDCYVEIVSKLLEKDPDVNLCDKYGRSPLWIACLKGNVEIVSMLLEKDLYVNLCDKYGQSPLWIACLKGNVEIVSKLLEKDPDVNLCDDFGRSPLWIACDRCNVEIVSKLLEKDPDVNLRDDDGQSSLCIACVNGNVEIVSKLLEKNPHMYVYDEDDDEDDLDPLYITCERYPLYIACENGNVEILSKLLEKDPEINVHDHDGWSPLGIACYNGNVQIVSKLLEKNPDVNICEEYGMSPLSIAKDQGHEEIIELLERYLGVESL